MIIALCIFAWLASGFLSSVALFSWAHWQTDWNIYPDDVAIWFVAILAGPIGLVATPVAIIVTDTPLFIACLPERFMNLAYRVISFGPELSMKLARRLFSKP